VLSGIIVAGRGGKSSVSGTHLKPVAFAVDNGDEALYALSAGTFWRPERRNRARGTMYLKSMNWQEH
jgi:hypothetical protein